jgi:hypothetical protein
MPFEPALTTRYSIKNFGYTVSYVVFDKITDKNNRQKDTQSRIQQIEVIGVINSRTRGNPEMNLVNKGFQQQGSQRSQQADNKAQNQNKIGFFDVFLPPKNHPDIPIFFAHLGKFVAAKDIIFIHICKMTSVLTAFLCMFAF